MKATRLTTPTAVGSASAAGVETGGPLRYETVAWDSLKPHVNNPRSGDLDAIAESLRVNGIYRPIVVAADGTILAGHHLWHAAGSLKYAEVPIVRLPVDPNSETARRIMLADNRTSDLGRYDDAALAEILQSLDADAGLSGTGYSPDDLSDLLALEAYRDRSTLGELMTHAGGAESAARVEGSVRDPGYAGYRTDYVSKDSRSLILPLALAEYDHIIALLAQARSRAGVDNNVDAIKAALEAFVA